MKSSVLRSITFCIITCVLPAHTAIAQSGLTDISTLRGKEILFIVGDSAHQAKTDDFRIKIYLESVGFRVQLTQVAEDAPAVGDVDLIIISSTADARVLRDAYKKVPVPILTWNAYMYSELAMTGDVLNEDFSIVRESVWHNRNHASFYSYCTNAVHPIARAADISSGMFLAMIFSGETDMNWGTPTAAADVIATFQGDPKKAGVFVYERGANMFGDVKAPARRAGIFLGDDSFRQLAYAEGPALQDERQRAWLKGRALFLSTIRWAIDKPRSASLEPQQLREALVRQARHKAILFLRRKNLPWPEAEKSDAAHIDFLRSHGFAVKVLDQTAPEQDTSNYDLIIISASTNKYKFGTKYANANIPVVLLEGKSVDSMKMAGRRRWVDYGMNDNKHSVYPPAAYVKVMRPFHVMAGGLAHGTVKMYDELGSIAWSTPAPGATIIATIPNQPHSAAIYGYEKGTTMAYDFVAPAKRALFPVDFNRFHHLTDEGLSLYRGVLLWSISASQE